MASSTTDDVQKILHDAEEYGAFLAEMLAASHFSDKEKAELAASIPHMSLEQLERLDVMLRKEMSTQSALELEEDLITIRAAQHKRDLSLAAIRNEVHEALEKVEEELKGSE